MKPTIEWDRRQGQPAPEYWINFLNSTVTLPDNQFEQKLVENGIVYVDERRCETSGVLLEPARLIFESEKHFTVFLLRWS